jgi:hypothetical protein
MRKTASAKARGKSPTKSARDRKRLKLYGKIEKLLSRLPEPKPAEPVERPALHLSAEERNDLGERLHQVIAKQDAIFQLFLMNDGDEDAVKAIEESVQALARLAAIDAEAVSYAITGERTRREILPEGVCWKDAVTDA